jgi:hypothetical protein
VTEGDLPIDIEWRKDGVTLLPDVTLSGPKVRRIDEYTSLLAISSLDTVHAGNYSCLASNAVAEVAKWAVLTIRGKILLHAVVVVERANDNHDKVSVCIRPNSVKRGDNQLGYNEIISIKRKLLKISSVFCSRSKVYQRFR